MREVDIFTSNAGGELGKIDRLGACEDPIGGRKESVQKRHSILECCGLPGTPRSTVHFFGTGHPILLLLRHSRFCLTPGTFDVIRQPNRTLRSRARAENVQLLGATSCIYYWKTLSRVISSPYFNVLHLLRTAECVVLWALSEIKREMLSHNMTYRVHTLYRTPVHCIFSIACPAASLPGNDGEAQDHEGKDEE